MSDDAAERSSRSDRERQHAASRDVWPGMGLLIAAFAVMLATDPGGWSAGNAAYALLMVLGFGLLVRAEVRRLRRADEYQRTQQLESLALAYVVVVVLLFGAGLLDSLGVGDARISLQVSFIGGVLAWSAAGAVRGRRV